jgi:hypothetical protein
MLGKEWLIFNKILYGNMGRRHHHNGPGRVEFYISSGSKWQNKKIKGIFEELFRRKRKD